MPENVVCNLCGREDAQSLFQLRDYRLRVDDAHCNVVRCRGCGLGYLNPRPTVVEVEKYYPSEYFARRPTTTRRYKRQAGYMPTKPGDRLDIGTAGGEFLALMRNRGWHVTGIEVSDAGNSYGLNVHRTAFRDSPPLPIGQFDVVTAWAVFEHLHDPMAAFRRIPELLRPSGTFIVQVPSLRSVNSRLARLELRRVHHVTRLNGGSGRGVFLHGLTRVVRKSTDDIFAFYRGTRRERFRQAPAFATAWTAVERVLIPDWLVWTLRLSGEVVAIMERPVTVST